VKALIVDISGKDPAFESELRVAASADGELKKALDVFNVRSVLCVYASSLSSFDACDNLGEDRRDLEELG
jgi:hypothetical protein